MFSLSSVEKLSFLGNSECLNFYMSNVTLYINSNCHNCSYVDGAGPVCFAHLVLDDNDDNVIYF